jgi:hypothetical protein
VTISDPGGREFSGFLIVVEPSGRAFALDGAGHATGQLQSSLTQVLFADLAAAGPLAQLPERNCDKALLIGWTGQRSSNLGCSADPRSIRLIDDITAIERALYVQSYRVATIQGARPSGYAAAATQRTNSGFAPATGYSRGGSVSSNTGSNYAAPAGVGFDSMNTNVGGYFGVGGNIGVVAPSGVQYQPGSFNTSNAIAGLNANGTFQGGTNLTNGQLSDTSRFSNNLSGLASVPSSTVPRGSFNNTGFSNNNSFSNGGSGLQNQGFSGSGSTFNSGVNGINQAH